MRPYLFLLSLTLLACEKNERSAPATPVATEAKTGTDTASTQKTETKTSDTPKRVTMGWPPYTCPSYAAATPTVQQSVDLKALKLVKEGELFEAIDAQAKSILRDTDKVTTRSDIPVDGCAATVVYSYDAEQFEDSGTSTAFSFKFWVCDGLIDKINFCPGIDGN